MKRAVAIAFVSVLIVALGLAQKANQSSATKNDAGAEQQVKQMEQQLRSEVVKGETSSMEKFEADDAVNVDGSGMALDKKHSIQMLKDGTVKYTAIDVKEEQVRSYGNTAIYSGLASTKVTVNGQQHNGDYRVTIVWAKLNGEWKRLSFQSTPVMAQAAK
ncbi:MAG TPA: nuclear transport factor 2 family protein [Candidatus Binatia bacterium]|nr:nuclear transport factor 2 family protein [Candidatus Binatia bacterium]